MTESKAWEWKENTDDYWLEPSQESYYFAHRWQQKRFRELLDFGCGLGRHSIFFAGQGFHVSAFDLSPEGVQHLNAWAQREKLSVQTQTADMKHLPYADASFDCLFAYHVISHTDTAGVRQTISEIERVLRPGGEIFFTLCAKDTWSFQQAGYPRIDENTLIKTEDGPEKGIPHFYVSLQDILRLLSGLQILSVRHTDDCYFQGRVQDSRHYFILAQKEE